jgi:hypothetical protein
MALPIYERNPTCNPIRSILGNFDGWLACLVNPIANFDPSEGIAECSGGAGAGCTDDFVHACSIGGGEWFLTDVEH